MLAEAITGLTVGAGYALLAVGVVLIYRSTRVLSLALGEIGAFGFYIGLRFHSNGIFGAHLPLLGAGGLAVAAGAAVALLTERFVMRPLVQRPRIDNFIVTLALALFLALVELNFFSPNHGPVAAPSVVGQVHMQVLGAFLTSTEIAELVLAALAATALYLVLRRTRFGLATRATTSNPEVARMLGVKVNNVYRFSWGVAGALAGAAGALVSNTNGSLIPLNLTVSLLNALAGAIIGGLDSLGGAVAGCLFIGVLQSLLLTLGPQYQTGATLLAVLVVLAARPQGVFGRAHALAG